VSVTTGSGCQWTAVSDRSWMSITSGGSGTGNGAVQVSLAPNTGEDRRTGTLSIAGHSVAVQEDGLGACTVDVSPGSAAVGAAPATGSFAISTAGHCQWTAVSTAPWARASIP